MTSIRAGDLVLVDKHGARFHAYVVDCKAGELQLRVIERNTTWRTARSREIVAHWRKSKASRI